MARIVGIHGIGQQFRGGFSLTRDWLPALKDGVYEAKEVALANSLTEADLAVSFYGSLFRAPGELSDGIDEDPSLTADDLETEAEVDLVEALYTEMVIEEPSTDQPPGALGPIRGGATALARNPGVQEMVARILQSRVFAGTLPEHVLIGNFKQVMEFLTDEVIKDRVLERVNERVDDTTSLFIGHSLGSVVAYEYLCRYQPPSVRALVTLGCPLGIPNVIFERLSPRPVDGEGHWPGPAIQNWVNIADPRDFVAMRKTLAPLFPAPDYAKPIDDRLVNNGPEPHGIVPYLNAGQTGSAVAAALKVAH